MLDYLDLYKKFIPVRQESYKLDYIAKVELVVIKIVTLMIHLENIQTIFKVLLITILKMLN